jgi:hypothetical protein
MRDLMAYTSLRLRSGALGSDDDLDPAEVIATIHRMRTGAAKPWASGVRLKPDPSSG